MPEQSERSNDWKSRYDLEEEEFVYKLIGMAQRVHLWDGGDVTYEQLARDNPHRAYVIAVEFRTLAIVDRFHSLNILDRMYAFDRFPIETSEGKILRHQWIRIILDVLLARLTSIRDCCFLLTAEIYDLGANPRNVNLRMLKRHIKDTMVTDLLSNIAVAASNFRDERDRHVHRGEERSLWGDLDKLFEVVAWAEGSDIRPPQVGIQDETGFQPVKIDLSEMYDRAINEIRREYYKEGDQLIALTRRLFEAVVEEFDRNWAKKRDNASLVRDWERS